MVNIRDPNDSNMTDSQIDEFDATVYEMDRIKLLKGWITEEGAHTVVIL